MVTSDHHSVRVHLLNLFWDYLNESYEFLKDVNLQLTCFLTYFWCHVPIKLLNFDHLSHCQKLHVRKNHQMIHAKLFDSFYRLDVSTATLVILEISVIKHAFVWQIFLSLILYLNWSMPRLLTFRTSYLLKKYRNFFSLFAIPLKVASSLSN